MSWVASKLGKSSSAWAFDIRLPLMNGTGQIMSESGQTRTSENRGLIYRKGSRANHRRANQKLGSWIGEVAQILAQPTNPKVCPWANRVGRARLTLGRFRQVTLNH
jgi:hypothetical protein